MSERLRLDLVLNDFVAGAIASPGRSRSLSDGTPWRPLIPVRDMARAIDWAVRRGPGSRGAFVAVNVGVMRGTTGCVSLPRRWRRWSPGWKYPSTGTLRRTSARTGWISGFSGELAPSFQPQEDLISVIGGLREGWMPCASGTTISAAPASAAHGPAIAAERRAAERKPGMDAHCEEA
ncbi:MAG: hypothetical protein U0411_06355 [Thermodesulfovibrionales bacterium]